MNASSDKSHKRQTSTVKRTGHASLSLRFSLAKFFTRDSNRLSLTQIANAKRLTMVPIRAYYLSLFYSKFTLVFIELAALRKAGSDTTCQKPNIEPSRI